MKPKRVKEEVVVREFNQDKPIVTGFIIGLLSAVAGFVLGYIIFILIS